MRQLLARGAAWGDYDNDGLIDLYISSTVSDNISRLLKNEGGVSFTDVTDISGPIGDTGVGRGVAWCDYDNDGDLDLFAARSNGAATLYENIGNCTFSDVTPAGLDTSPSGAEPGALWADHTRAPGDV